MEHLHIVPYVFSVACFSSGCDGNASGEMTGKQAGQLSGKLTRSGSSTVARLVTEIAKRFESLQPGVRINVQTGGSGKGIADVRLGMADIGMASRPLNNEEADRTNNWQQVGGADQPIIVVHKAGGRATLEVFLAH